MQFIIPVGVVLVVLILQAPVRAVTAAVAAVGVRMVRPPGSSCSCGVVHVGSQTPQAVTGRKWQVAWLDASTQYIIYNIYIIEYIIYKKNNV